MSNEAHGRVLIINNMKVKGHVVDRLGSEKDVEKLKMTFKKLRFAVRHLLNSSILLL